MLMSKKRYITFGLLLYLFALIMTLPADLFSKQINSINPRIQVTGLDGSLWHGRIKQLSINNKLLDDVEWDFQVLALLLGRIQLSLAYADTENDIQLDVASGIGGNIQLKSINGQLSPSFVQSFTPYPVPSFRGAMIFDDVDIIFKARRPQQAQGQIEWRGATVELGEKIPLGNLLLSLEQTQKGINAVLIEQSGLLSGKATMLLASDGRYNIEAKFTPTGKGRHLERHLSLVLRKGPDGSYIRTLKGQLP